MTRNGWIGGLTHVAATILALPVMSAATFGVELRRTHTIGTPQEALEYRRRVEFVSWLDEETIVYWSRNGKIVCRDLKNEVDRWTVDDVPEVWDWRVARQQQKLAVVSFSFMGKGEDQDRLRVIDCRDGKILLSVDREQLSELVGSYFFPWQVAWKPDDGRLVVCDHGGAFGPHAYVLDESFKKIAAKFDVDSSVSELTISPDGKRATTVAEREVVCVRDLTKNQDVHFQGTRVLQDSGSIGVAIDAPFISHARHDGKNRLIYTVDSYWTGGTVYVVNLESKVIKSFPAGNQHVELDVDFERRRIALSGTSADLMLVNYDGDRLAFDSGAALQRIACVEFSPTGKQIAVASFDGSVTIFSIDE